MKKMSDKFTLVIHSVNVSKVITNHLVGEHHKPIHRKMVGIVIMLIGVCVAKASGTINHMIIHILGDATGYTFHAIGAIPFLQVFEKSELHQREEDQAETPES